MLKYSTNVKTTMGNLVDKLFYMKTLDGLYVKHEPHELAVFPHLWQISLSIWTRDAYYEENFASILTLREADWLTCENAVVRNLPEYDEPRFLCFAQIDGESYLLKFKKKNEITMHDYVLIFDFVQENPMYPVLKHSYRYTERFYLTTADGGYIDYCEIAGKKIKKMVKPRKPFHQYITTLSNASLTQETTNKDNTLFRHPKTYFADDNTLISCGMTRIDAPVDEMKFCVFDPWLFDSNGNEKDASHEFVFITKQLMESVNEFRRENHIDLVELVYFEEPTFVMK